MKLLFVTGDLSGGGAERVVSLLASYFAEKGHDTHIICAIQTNGSDAYSVSEKVNITRIPHDYNEKNRALRITKSILKLRKAIINIDPDIVVSFQEVINVRTLIATKGIGVPVIGAVRANPFIYTKGFLRFLCRILYPYAKGMVYQTSLQQEAYKPIESRIDCAIFNPCTVPELYSNAKTKEKIIASSGRLHKTEKDYFTLINAFARIASLFPDHRLLIYGEGNDRSELEKLISELNLNDRVILPGFCKDIFTELVKSELFVFSSKVEGLPNALIEAMCMGLPCISTRFSGGGAEMLIKDGENGVLVPVGDVDAMAAAIEDLLSNPNKRRLLGANAKKLRELVNIDTIAQHWMELFSEIQSNGSI